MQSIEIRIAMNGYIVAPPATNVAWIPPSEYRVFKTLDDVFAWCKKNLNTPEEQGEKNVEEGK